VYNGQIEIKNIAREAGYRSKVAVAALQEGIDPVGACVGMRGIRIQNIVKELHDEKIDVIEWNPKQEVFIEKALSPARVTGVYLDDDPDTGRTAVVIVPDDQLSLAIGREGQNARLAAKLTGWRIDIKSVTEAVTNALDKIDQLPISELASEKPELVQEVVVIMEKKAANLTVMPEEYRVLNQFADLVERRLQGVREDVRQARLAELNAVRATLPQHAFGIPVNELDLPDDMIEVLQPLESVGEIMLRFLIDENRLRRLLGNHPDTALEQLQEALDKIVTPEDDEELFTEEPQLEAEEVAPVEEAPSDELQEPEVETASPDSELVDAFPDEEVETTSPEIETPAPAIPEQSEIADDFVPEEFYEEGADSDTDSSTTPKEKRKKERQKRRQLVFDENTGQTIAKRRRKGSRKREIWEDDIDI
jgi:transcription termination/antitermination protein NusA